MAKKNKVDGSPILWFQTFAESANHLEYLRNTQDAFYLRKHGSYQTEYR